MNRKSFASVLLSAFVFASISPVMADQEYADSACLIAALDAPGDYSAAMNDVLGTSSNPEIYIFSNLTPESADVSQANIEPAALSGFIRPGMTTRQVLTIWIDPQSPATPEVERIPGQLLSC